MRAAPAMHDEAAEAISDGLRGDAICEVLHPPWVALVPENAIGAHGGTQVHNCGTYNKW